MSKRSTRWPKSCAQRWARRRSRTESGRRAKTTRQLQAFALIIGGFCALLALIGLANALTNALSFGVQRAREFARYTALGMTRGQIRKMLCIEALAVALRPILVALPIAALAVALMLSASRLDPLRYLPRAPIRPLLLFIAATLLPTLLTYVAVSCKRKKSARLKADFM